MKMFSLLIATAIAAVLSAPASAKSYEQMAAERFVVADTNKDGKLTKAEAKKGMPRIYNNFDRIDTANRGYVTVKQVKAGIAAATR